MSLTAYIRYDSQGRIVPGGPIVTKTKPAVGNWQVVTQGTSATLVGQLRAFVKLDRYNKPLAGSLFLGKSKPATGKWIEVNATYEGAVAPTTTTTTSSSTSTTTSTTTIAGLQIKWERSDSGNACSSTNYVYLTGNPDICTATDVYGDFSSIINSGSGPGTLIILSNGATNKWMGYQVIDSTRLTSLSWPCNNC